MILRTLLLLPAVLHLLPLLAQATDTGAYKDALDEPELVCDVGGICKCYVGNDEAKVLNCRKATIEDALVDGNSVSLDTAYLKVANESFDPAIVDLAHNTIDRLEKGRVVPGHEATIVMLDFTYNVINDIEEGTFDAFSKLQVLKLTRNHLNSRDFDKKWLTSAIGDTLHQLYLGDNSIKTLPDDAFDDLVNLNKLVLDHNENLTLTKKTFGSGLAKLEKLSLDYCNIATLEDGVFDKLVNLKALSLIGNPLVKMPAALNALPLLSSLDLSETFLPEFITLVLKDDSKLQELFMKSMPFLYTIDECAFCRLSSLTKIDFSNSSQLYRINPGAFGALSNTETFPQNLTSINFANCNLTTLDEHMLKWDTVEYLSISGNPFNCDCNMKWLITNPKYHHFVGDELPRCASPSELAGTSFNRAMDYVCGGPASGASAGEVFLLVLVLFGLSCTVLAVVFFASGQKRITNMFYRPELPQMGYKNLATRPDADDAHITLEDDFEPRPEAV